jgi:S-adenosylmethionine-dependent methyltransferase
MGLISSEEYDQVVDEWKQWQECPWNRLLYSVSRSNLSSHLPKRPIRVLDVGGGNGADAIHLARLGNEVTLLDYSPQMLEAARVAAIAANVIDHVTFCQADAAKLATALSGERFDLILCHLILKFVSDCREMLRQAWSMLAPGGLISIMDANRYSEVFFRAIQNEDLASARNAVNDREYFHRRFQRETPVFASAEVIDMLQTDQCEVVGNYGVRCICDYLPNEPKYDDRYYRALERLERRLTSTYPYPLLARYYQVILRKETSRSVPE